MTIIHPHTNEEYIARSGDVFHVDAVQEVPSHPVATTATGHWASNPDGADVLTASELSVMTPAE